MLRLLPHLLNQNAFEVEGCRIFLADRSLREAEQNTLHLRFYLLILDESLSIVRDWGKNWVP
jgi:hypothetical protein